MKKNRMDKSLAKSFAAALNNVLKVEANSTSCLIVYQPKVPKELSKFRTNK
ncbi:MAG: cyclic lactone autoinducer peptide [Oliverpabstia sp.]|uniref:cyclic lactone autoinducer peptide n=1 Tax=Floccifex sp. TaxID=2815810 RepID=UPI002A7E3954|nr:cyclic lactone autoinducer peptide [Eubacterium sp.]MDY2594214.1 cyclic lactone autoinducer peptide [Oliverpabstia sp.]